MTTIHTTFASARGGLEHYLDQVKRQPLLAPEQERELAERWRMRAIQRRHGNWLPVTCAWS